MLRRFTRRSESEKRLCCHSGRCLLHDFFGLAPVFTSGALGTSRALPQQFGNDTNAVLVGMFEIKPAALLRQEMLEPLIAADIVLHVRALQLEQRRFDGLGIGMRLGSKLLGILNPAGELLKRVSICLFRVSFPIHIALDETASEKVRNCL